MKKIILIAVTTICVLLQSSCLTTLQPVVTLNNMIFDKRLTGTWHYKNDVIRIEKMDESHIYHELNKISGYTSNWKPLRGKEKDDSAYYSKAYSVSFQKKGVDYYMIAAITRLNNNLFMDLLPIAINDPQQPDGSGYELSYDYLPTFTTAKLEITGNNSIAIKFLNGDYIKEQIQNNRMRISHEKNEVFDSYLVTASSHELQEFLEKYGHDERLFSKESSVTLTKKG